MEDGKKIMAEIAKEKAVAMSNGTVVIETTIDNGTIDKTAVENGMEVIDKTVKTGTAAVVDKTVAVEIGIVAVVVEIGTAAVVDKTETDSTDKTMDLMVDKIINLTVTVSLIVKMDKTDNGMVRMVN